MRNLLNPKWLFLINTLPIAILFFLGIGQYHIINTLLNEGNIYLWKTFGLALYILGVLNLFYAVYLTVKRQKISVWYAVIALCTYIPFLYLYGDNFEKIMPLSIPQWMLSGNLFMYVGTFLMPTLAYSLFILVAQLTPENKTHKPWVNFLIAISIPIAGYLFIQIVLPLWRNYNNKFQEHTLIILFIVATILFLFFLVRGIFIIATKKAVAWQQYQLAWKIPIAIIFPILGLQINNGHLLNNFGAGESGIFGNFDNPWFYILTIANGILICLPNPEHKFYRLFLFIGRSICFAYTLYFFLVFLPFLPISIIAIIAIGTGFLMLTPLLLFVIHVNEISKDFSFLKIIFPKNRLIILSILGFLLIPFVISFSYLKDKSILNDALEYVYSPDYSKQYHIDKKSLAKTLNVVKQQKEKNGPNIFNDQIPYLSAYFKWIVLDNLTLSDQKINFIEQIFYGTKAKKNRPENIVNQNVKITRIESKSTYDTTQKVWKTWVDLEISNKSDDNGFAEFATTIDLPEGCWISDYYLFVGDKKEPGILAEKKSAMWVFSNIRNERRDPGILYYLTGNKVAFRVYPFARNEVRKTGIEFLHKEPLPLTLDNHIIQMGDNKIINTENIESENVVYVNSNQKKYLKKIYRKPYFHFLVDASKDQKNNATNFSKRIATFLSNNKALAENAHISFVNSGINTFPLDKDWRNKFQTENFDGGFFLDRAIRTTLFNAYKNKVYPVIVVVTDSINNAVLEKDFSDLKITFPESPLFFHLDDAGHLQAHSLLIDPKKQIVINQPISFEHPVVEYKFPNNATAYLPDDDKPNILLKKDIFETNETQIKEKNWQSALEMQGNWIAQNLHPEYSDKTWLKLVRYSFISKIMTPQTSYLVVENEAQKAILKKKQEQVLSGNKSLDPDEEAQRMSEPGFWILLVLIGVFLGIKEIKRLKMVG